MLNICTLDTKTLYKAFNRHLFNPTGSEVWAKYLSYLSPWYPLYPSCDVCAGCCSKVSGARVPHLLPFPSKPGGLSPSCMAISPVQFILLRWWGWWLKGRNQSPCDWLWPSRRKIQVFTCLYNKYSGLDASESVFSIYPLVDKSGTRTPSIIKMTNKTHNYSIS